MNYPSIRMLIGYSKSGKDTLCKQLNSPLPRYLPTPKYKCVCDSNKGIFKEYDQTAHKKQCVLPYNCPYCDLYIYGELHVCNNVKRYTWIIYRSMTSSDSLSKKPGVRVAFADKLKEMVVNCVSNYLPAGFDIDKDKDKKIVINEGEVSIRDLCIDLGAKKRRESVDYWCNQAFEPMVKKEDCRDIIVTDCRFENEIEYSKTIGKVTTARLFRTDTNIPARSIESEHSLDDYTTDFLLVPSKGDFDVAATVFPQYKDYVPYDRI